MLVFDGSALNTPEQPISQFLDVHSAYDCIMAFSRLDKYTAETLDDIEKRCVILPLKSDWVWAKEYFFDKRKNCHATVTRHLKPPDWLSFWRIVLQAVRWL